MFLLRRWSRFRRVRLSRISRLQRRNRNGWVVNTAAVAAAMAAPVATCVNI